MENEEFQEDIGDSDNGCDAKNLLLKKNSSWNATLSSNNLSINPLNSLAQSRSFRAVRSKSNPHVLDGVVIPSANKKIKSLQQLISNRFSSQVLLNSGNVNCNNGRTKNNKLAPLAKAISFTSMTTTNQTLSTPTAIQLTMRQRRPIYSFSKFLLYCKVITHEVIITQKKEQT
jgi:hypothetical protein